MKGAICGLIHAATEMSPFIGSGRSGGLGLAQSGHDSLDIGLELPESELI